MIAEAEQFFDQCRDDRARCYGLALLRLVKELRQSVMELTAGALRKERQNVERKEREGVERKVDRRVTTGLWKRNGSAVRFNALLVLLCCLTASAVTTTNISLTYAQGPEDNPMKGFVPFQSNAGRGNFPHSLEYMYLSLRDTMTASNTFDWTTLDGYLNSASNSGVQFVFTPYIDFPTKTTAIPQYLLDGGLTTYNYTDYGNSTSVSPNYEDMALRHAFTNFIAHLGARYDGDSRLACIHLGLLGFWGEWHCETVTYASTTVEAEVFSAYTNYFHNTRLVMRYPLVANAATTIGYADFAFCQDTVAKVEGTGFMLYMTNAGALDKWKTQMIGGEVYPELWNCLFDATPCGVDAFDLAVDTTHASWQLHTGAFDAGLTGDRRTRTLAGARRMGYDLFVKSCIITNTGTNLGVGVTITNTGVAPFYYDWQVQMGALSNGAIVKTWTNDWHLTTILPATSTNLVAILASPPSGTNNLLLRVVNPLVGGKTFRFANVTQDSLTNGWLTLGAMDMSALSEKPVSVIKYNIMRAGSVKGL